MKKSIVFLTAFFSAALFTACGLVDFSVDKTEIVAPVVTENGGVITVNIQGIPSYKYVNVIRYEVTDGTDQASIVPDTTFNIGQCVPQPNRDGLIWTGSMSFLDHYTDSTKFYQYILQYMTSTGHVKSNSTKTIAGGGTGAMVLSPDTTPVKVYYNSVTGILTVETTYFSSLPETYDSTAGNEKHFKLMVILNNGTKTQLFEMAENGIGDYAVSLKSRLPDNFIGKNLTLEGFVGHSIDSVPGEDGDYPLFKTYCWTTPVVNAGGNIQLYKIEDGQEKATEDIVVETVKDEDETYDYAIEK